MPLAPDLSILIWSNRQQHQIWSMPGLDFGPTLWHLLCLCAHPSHRFEGRGPESCASMSAAWCCLMLLDAAWFWDILWRKVDLDTCFLIISNGIRIPWNLWFPIYFPYIPIVTPPFFVKNSPEAIDTVGLCKRARLTFGHVAGAVGPFWLRGRKPKIRKMEVSSWEIIHL